MTSFNTVVEIGCHFQNTVLDLPECRGARIWMIEAVNEIFQQLPDVENVTKICAAITPDYTGKGTMQGIALTTQKEKNLPEWSTTMASLRDSHPTIQKFEWDNILSKFDVDCYSVEDAWEKFNLPKVIDFLSTDLEGLDFPVLLSIFNNNIQPKLLRFESKLMSKNELTILQGVLVNNGLVNFTAGENKDFAGVPYNHYAWQSNYTPSIELL